MKPRFAVLSAATAASALAAVSFTQARQTPDPVAFDPLFATGAACAPARAGRPPVLANLLLAQAETRPFQPGRLPPGKAPPAKAGPPPLYDNLGTLHVPITTTNPEAQAYFDQGMRLTFAFNHAEAARAFRAAQALDATCAMCHWGEALVLGPNINAPMFPEAVAPAFRAVSRRYSADPDADRGEKRAALDKAYADAMAAAARAHPGDDTIQVLFAEAMMDLTPWDYWAAAGTRPKNRTAEMADALERVLGRNPSHPGAAHYYIHLMEASARPEKALPAARVLARQIPGAGHVVHMPSHIYYRLGMYREALQSNIEAVAVDEKYFSTSPSDPVYRGAYYPHNIHFVMVSALMGGDGATTLAAAGKLDKAVGTDAVKAIGALQPVKAAPYFAHVQFSTPDVLVALPDPGSDFVLVKAMWHYARAIGYVRNGAADAANREVAAIDRIERTADFKPLTDWAIPGRDIVRTARAVARGRVADLQGNLPRAIAAYREAVTIQDALPYMEPPYWYYPVRQSLGVALLRAGQLDKAEEVFRTSLARTPSNGWALRGLMEVYRIRGDSAALAATRQRFAKTWLGKPEGPPLSAL